MGDSPAHSWCGQVCGRLCLFLVLQKNPEVIREKSHKVKQGELENSPEDGRLLNSAKQENFIYAVEKVNKKPIKPQWLVISEVGNMSLNESRCAEKLPSQGR